MGIWDTIHGISEETVIPYVLVFGVFGYNKPMSR